MSGETRIMKQSDPLELVTVGTLERPGPVGRTVRLLLGLVCLYVLYDIAEYRSGIVSTPLTTLPNLLLALLVALWLFNYVVNIGFSRSWGRRPVLWTLALLITFAGLSLLVFGSADHPLFGAPLFLVLAYFYAHLGLSFVLAAAIATPGCEMRAIPELLGRVRGRDVPEHHCPAAFIARVDEWEHKRRNPAARA